MPDFKVFDFYEFTAFKGLVWGIAFQFYFKLIKRFHMRISYVFIRTIRHRQKQCPMRVAIACLQFVLLLLEDIFLFEKQAFNGLSKVFGIQNNF